MEKRARGEIRVHERGNGRLTFSIRFRVNGKRVSLTLGTNEDGWTYRKAERKLDDVLAQIRARPTRRVLEPDELTELLAHAGRMDRHLRRDRQIGRRPMITVMAKAGLRVTELCQLRWRAVDVHHERLIVLLTLSLGTLR